MEIFVAPAAAFQPMKRTSLAKRVLALFQGRILSSVALFLLALAPILAVVGLLTLSAILSHAAPAQTLSIAISWFFIMLPYAAILTPAVIFFLQLCSRELPASLYENSTVNNA